MSGSSPSVKLVELADLNPSLPVTPETDTEVSFVPMAALDAETASISVIEERPYKEVSKGYTPFLDGDVLVAKITPCFENGKIAQANCPDKSDADLRSFMSSDLIQTKQTRDSCCIS